MNILEELQRKQLETFYKELDYRMMYDTYSKTKEELEKEHNEYENRKVFIMTNKGLRCAKITDTSIIYEVGDNYEMTDKVDCNAIFSRWATGFDV
jgi:hypothetical protein